MFALNFNKTVMPIFYGKATLIDFLNTIKTSNSTLGFVPTMGALHQGHLSLIEQSLAKNSTTVVSIFVNPTQFNNQEDLEKYPRTLENDTYKIFNLNKNIIVYAPTVEDIYEGKVLSDIFNFDGLENQMEGKFRPGHFDGVGTIVMRLFEIVSPNNAYFGEKDFQQLQIVKKMVQKQNLNVTIIGCSIFREKNGLAMSSRNEQLTKNQREEAAIIYKSLKEAKKIFETKSANQVTKYIQKVFKKNPTFELEYFQIADEVSLIPCVKKSINKNYRAFIAVFINNIRLIDNISLK